LSRALERGLHDLGFDTWQGQEIFLFFKMSRSVGTGRPFTGI